MPTTLARLRDMRTRANRYMQDTCILIGEAEIGRNPDNLPTMQDDESAPTACKFEPMTGTEVSTGSQTVIADGIVRLPQSQLGSISNTGRVRITHRHGEALDTPLEYEIAGTIAEQPTMLVLALRLWK